MSIIQNKISFIFIVEREYVRHRTGFKPLKNVTFTAFYVTPAYPICSVAVARYNLKVAKKYLKLSKINLQLSNFKFKVSNYIRCAQAF